MQWNFWGDWLLKPDLTIAAKLNVVMLPWGAFLESPANFSGPESYFMSARFTLKIQILLVFKTKQLDCKLTRHIELVWGLKATPLSIDFDFGDITTKMNREQ